MELVWRQPSWLILLDLPLEHHGAKQVKKDGVLKKQISFIKCNFFPVCQDKETFDKYNPNEDNHSKDNHSKDNLNKKNDNKNGQN